MSVGSSVTYYEAVGYRASYPFVVGDHSLTDHDLVTILRQGSSVLAQLSNHYFFQPQSFFVAAGQHQRLLFIRQLARCLNQLTSNNEFSYEACEVYFQSLQRLDQDLYDTILEGLALYFDNRRLASSYILTLQLERFIRAYVHQLDHATQELTRYGPMEKPLGRLLPIAARHLPASLYHYLIWVCKDYRGLNLRNTVAHGLLTTANQTEALNAALIHLLSLLTNHYNHQDPRIKPEGLDGLQ